MTQQQHLVIEKGNALVYYAFDVGASIDIIKAEQLLCDGEKENASARKAPPSEVFRVHAAPSSPGGRGAHSRRRTAFFNHKLRGNVDF